jgi:Acetyltransferase (GNAT) domain
LEISEFENRPSFKLNPSFIFNDPALARNIDGERPFVYLNSATTDWSLCLLLQVKDRKAFSQASMPFGGIDTRGPMPSKTKIVSFYEKLIDRLSKSGIESFEVKLPPEAYNEELVSKQFEALLGLGFVNSGEGINFHLELQGPFENHLHQSLKRKYKKALAENWKWEISGIKGLPDFFEFSRKCRNKKNLPINISEELLTDQFKRQPDRYDLFSVRRKSKIIASGIGVRVSTELYYKFLPSTDPEYNNLSPMVFLSSIMYERAREVECRKLDLGIAGPLGGPENHGLEVFKSRLGGKPSLKCSFLKIF